MRRALLAAIRFYRRRLSGRGPLRRVRCTFAHGESCSAYGLRAAEEAPSVRVAVARIRGRLRRCRDASIYALTAPDGQRALGWGADHDRPLAELVADLDAAGEQPAAVATVLAARETVARYRRDLGDVVAVSAQRRGLPRADVLVRPAPTRRSVALRRLRAAVVLLPLLVLLVALSPVLALAATVLLALHVAWPSPHAAELARQGRAAALQRQPA